MSKIDVVNPLNKSLYKTFLNQFIQIYFFQEKAKQEKLDELKNVFFAETADENYNNLVNFIVQILNKKIKTDKDSEDILAELNEEYNFEEDTFNLTVEIISSLRDKIISFLNKDFNIDTTKNLDKVNWSAKIILQGDADNYLSEKYSDIEFYTTNKIGKKFYSNITFFKSDINKFVKELNNIKKNLQEIKNIN